MRPLLQYFNQIKDKFWVAMIIVPLVTFVFGFLMTAIILVASGNFGIVSKETDEIPVNEVEVPVDAVQAVNSQIQFEPADFYFVQLGSFNAQSNAEAACESIENKNIYASWIKSNTQYKVFTALTFSESRARSYRNSFVELYAEHQDAYVVSVPVEFNTFEFWSGLDQIDDVKKDFLDFYYEADLFWMELSDEMSVDMDSIKMQIAPLQRILEILSSYEENADTELTKFVRKNLEIFQNLIDQNAGGSELSGAYAEQLLELTR